MVLSVWGVHGVAAQGALLALVLVQQEVQDRGGEGRVVGLVRGQGEDQVVSIGRLYVVFRSPSIVVHR